MGKKVKVNKEILKWARTSARVSLEKAARTVSKSCKADRIKEWESPDGKDSPTESQLKKLARLYRRPREVFNLPYIPADFPKLKDFRKDKEEPDTGTLFIMREIQEKQDWLKNFNRKNKARKLSFIGKYTIKSDAETVARDIRKTLGINMATNSLKPLKYWIDRAEEIGIYVALSSNFHTRLKLNSDVFKAFAIADSFAPFIFLNSEDWDEGQLFTFAHELAHLWIGVSGISNDTGLLTDTDALHPVEKFCNEVATRVLMPTEDLSLFLPSSPEISFKHIAKAGRKLGLSHKKIILQAVKTGLIDSASSGSLLKEADERWKEFLDKEARKPKSKGGPNYYIMQLRRNSRAFSNIVLDSYKKGKLSGQDAGRLLNMREANFVKFENYVFRK